MSVRRLLGWGAPLLAVLSVACARPRPPRAVSGSPTGQVEALVRQALVLDAARDRAGDSLYAPEAIVVANARVRLGPPRFAGIGNAGRVTVAAASVTRQGSFAWAMVDYRWLNVDQRLAEAGRATIILEERLGRWQIIHAHSSQLLPWDR